MEQQNNYGLLLRPDIKLHRQYFNEMVRLIGIQVIYRAVKPDKHWTMYAEIESSYEPPMLVGCIFDEHPTQKTMKKLGWDSERTTDASIISVPYDTPNIQVGCLFIIPSGIDGAVGRLFRITKLSNIMVYPASITCEIVPEYEDTMDKTELTFQHSSFNVLNTEED